MLLYTKYVLIKNDPGIWKLWRNFTRRTIQWKSGRQAKNRKSHTEFIEIEEEIEVSDTRASPEGTSNSKYRCRYGGLLFETMEAHDQHHRKVHGQSWLICRH